MNGEDRTREKLKALENMIGELAGFKQQIADLIASENFSQTDTDALRKSERKAREALRESERKAEEALRESEREAREVIDNLPQRLFVKDKNLAYRYCNEHYAQDLQIQPHEIAGKTDYDLYPKDLAAKYTADEQRILDTGQPEEIEDRSFISGKERTLLSTKIPLKDEMGNVTGLLATLSDISERRKEEEEAKKYILRLKKLIFERSAQIESLNDQLHKEAMERKRVEEELQKVRASLGEGGNASTGQIQNAKMSLV